MSERDLTIPKEYRRTVSRAEVFSERLDEYRRALPAGPIDTWEEVIEKRRVRIKSLRAMGRLKSQLTEFSDSAPDLSNSLLGLQHEVTRLAIIDKEIGLGEERWDFDSKISQFRSVKRYEERRSSGFPDFQELLKQSEQLPTNNNRLFINTEDRQIVFGDRLVTIKEDRDWEVFLHIVRNRSKDILPQEIEKIARDNGVEDSQAAANSIRRLRRLLESEPARPEIITTNNPSTRGASYSFSLKNVRFYRPSEEINNSTTAENSGDSEVDSRENIVDMDAFKRRTELRRRQGEILQRDDAFYDHVQELSAIYDRAILEGKIPPDKSASLDQVGRVFSGVNIRFIKQMIKRGFLNPEVGSKGNAGHPVFSQTEVIYLAYLRKYGIRLSLPAYLVKETFSMIEEVRTKINADRSSTK